MSKRRAPVAPRAVTRRRARRTKARAPGLQRLPVYHMCALAAVMAYPLYQIASRALRPADGLFRHSYRPRAAVALPDDWRISLAATPSSRDLPREVARLGADEAEPPASKTPMRGGRRTRAPEPVG